MALSEHEEALLQQMEEALYAEDPRFASRIEKTKSRGLRRGRLVLGVAVGALGLTLIIFGAMSAHLWLGAVGFAAMVGGIGYAITPAKPPVSADAESSHGASDRPGRRGSFMERLEQRWERRRRDGW